MRLQHAYTMQQYSHNLTDQMDCSACQRLSLRRSLQTTSARGSFAKCRTPLFMRIAATFHGMTLIQPLRIRLLRSNNGTNPRQTAKQSTAQRVQIEWHYGIRSQTPCHIWFTTPIPQRHSNGALWDRRRHSNSACRAAFASLRGRQLWRGAITEMGVVGVPFTGSQ